jgi:hypothetical protein
MLYLQSYLSSFFTEIYVSISPQFTFFLQHFFWFSTLNKQTFITRMTLKCAVTGVQYMSQDIQPAQNWHPGTNKQFTTEDAFLLRNQLSKKKLPEVFFFLRVCVRVTRAL